MSGTLWMLPVVLCVACVCVVLVGWAALSHGKHGPPLRPGWMCGVVGLRGHGKSLFVARLIAQRLAGGVNVVANFPIAGGANRMVSWEDAILAPERSMVVLDEAHQWARARAGQSLDAMADWYVSHARKLEHEVWWIAQDETQVASGVRVQTNEYVECKRVWKGRHKASSYSPREFRKAKVKPLWSWFYQPKGAALQVYDTMELVRPVVREPMSKAETAARINELIDQIYARRGLVLAHVSTGEPEPASASEQGTAAAGVNVA